MRLILGILFFLLIFSCQTESEKASTQEPEKKTVKPQLPESAVKVIPYNRIKKPFYLDSMVFDFFVYNQLFFFRGYFPKSRNKLHQGYNDLISTFFENYFQSHYGISDDQGTPDSVVIDLWVTRFSDFGSLISVELTEQDYFSGRETCAYCYFSINYDFTKNKKIELKDLLRIEVKEMTKFCRNVNNFQRMHRETNFITASDFSEGSNFLISSEGITLLSGHGQDISSLQRLFVPDSLFATYLNPEYSYLFEK